MIHHARLDDLRGLVGQPLGSSDWVELTPQRIDQFAQATGGHPWIDDAALPAAAGPSGTTIAQGFLTLSLIAALSDRAFAIDDVTMGLNYGLNRVRFAAPVPVGSRLRGHFRLLGFEPLDGGAQLAIEARIEREGAPEPVCVAESLTRRYR